MLNDFGRVAHLFCAIGVKTVPVSRADAIVHDVQLSLMQCAAVRIQSGLIKRSTAFSSPEAAPLLVSTKNRDLWPCPTTEVADSRTSRHSAHALSQVWQIWLVLVSIYCVNRLYAPLKKPYFNWQLQPRYSNYSRRFSIIKISISITFSGYK